MVATIESLIINLFLGMVSPLYDFFFRYKEVNNSNNKFVLKTNKEESECYYVAIYYNSGYWLTK